MLCASANTAGQQAYDLTTPLSFPAQPVTIAYRFTVCLMD
jgi:hypothetical protein